MDAELDFIEPNQGILTYLKKIYGNDNVYQEKRKIFLSRNLVHSLKPVLSMKEEFSVGEQGIRKFADYIHASIEQNLVGVNSRKHIENIRQKGIPEIFGGLGMISQLESGFRDHWLCLGSDVEKKAVLQNEILPQIIDVFPKQLFCVAVNLDYKYQQSILSLYRVGLQVDRHGLEKAEEIRANDVGFGLGMQGGFEILNMLGAYVGRGSIGYTLPLNLSSTSSFHLYVDDGSIKFGSEMRKSFQNYFQTSTSLFQDYDYGGSTAVGANKINKDYNWRYLRYSVECVNRIISYANNPFNFVDQRGVVQGTKKLQFLCSLHLLYADILAINYTSSRHIQYHLAFSAIEKIANLILGNVKNKKTKTGKEARERNVNHILLLLKSSEEIKTIISECIGETKEDVSESLIAFCDKIYKDFHGELKKYFNQDKEEKNISQFYEFRRFYAHGAFLNEDTFERAYFNTSAKLPSSMIFLPFLLLLALTSNPQQFFDYFANEIAQYDHGKFKL